MSAPLEELRDGIRELRAELRELRDLLEDVRDHLHPDELEERHCLLCGSSSHDSDEHLELEVMGRL